MDLALARVINYAIERRSKLWRHSLMALDASFMFIVQATDAMYAKKELLFY